MIVYFTKILLLFHLFLFQVTNGKEDIFGMHLDKLFALGSCNGYGYKLEYYIIDYEKYNSVEGYHDCIYTFNLTLINLPLRSQLNNTFFHKINVCDVNFLYMHNLNIKSLDSGVFHQIRFLQELNLEHNILSEINSGVFSNLTYLVYLNLGHNVIKKIEKESFTNLNNLKLLILENNDLKNIYLGCFSGLIGLTDLNLENNSLQTISPGGFNGIDNLQVLNLKNNKMKIVSTGIFHNLSKLRTLILENNTLVEIITESFNGMSNLNNLQLANNKLSEIHVNTFYGLSSLIELNLKNNKIKSINNSSFTGLHNLEYLNLDNNERIYEEPFKILSNLRNLHLSKNKLGNLTDKSLYGLFSLSHLYLSHNNISFIGKQTLYAVPNITELDLSFNSLSDDSFLFCSNYTDRLTTLDISNNNFTHPKCVPRFLNTFNISYNVLKSVTANIFPQTLRNLDMSNNVLSSINLNCFENLASLTFLSLAHNHIRDLLNEWFKDLINLNSLNLSYNKISELKFGVFINLINLKTLDISSNKLTQLHYYTFHTMNHLTFLNFDHNEISEIPKVDYIKGYLPKLEALSIDDNNWSCKKLASIWLYFKHTSVSIRQGSSFATSNVNGIACSEEDNSNNFRNNLGNNDTYDYDSQIDNNIFIDLVKKLVNKLNTIFPKNSTFNYPKNDIILTEIKKNLKEVSEKLNKNKDFSNGLMYNHLNNNTVDGNNATSIFYIIVSITVLGFFVCIIYLLYKITSLKMYRYDPVTADRLEMLPP